MTNVNQVRTNLIKFAKRVMRVVRNIAGVRGFQLDVCASCNASLSTYPASMEADLEPAGDGQPRRGARFWPPAWSFADCDVSTVAVTGKGCHDLSKDIQLANRIIRGERSQMLSAGVVVALEQPILLVFLNAIQVTRTPHVPSSLRRRAFLMTELQWHFSVPLDQRARRQFQRWIVGQVGKGSRSSGCLVMVVLLLFAPRSLGGFSSRLPLRLLLRSRLRVVR